MRCSLLAESLELSLCMLPACSDPTAKLLCDAANTVQFLIGRGGSVYRQQPQLSWWMVRGYAMGLSLANLFPQS